MSDDKKSVIVGVGPIGLSTDDVEACTLVAGGESIDLTSMELKCLHSAIHAFEKAMEE